MPGGSAPGEAPALRTGEKPRSSAPHLALHSPSRGAGLALERDDRQPMRSFPPELPEAVTLFIFANSHPEQREALYMRHFFGALFGAGTCGGHSHPQLTSCILWADLPQEIHNEAGGLSTITCSDVQRGWAGEGNIDVAPRIWSGAGFHYLLRPGSPCIDAGDPAIEDGISHRRLWWPARHPNGARSDVGAYGGAGNGGWLDRELFALDVERGAF